MADKVFLDTNILAYALDRAAGEKARVAIEYIKSVSSKSRPVVSTQVFDELVWVATKKLGVAPLAVKEVLRNLYETCELVVVDEKVIELGIDFHVLEPLSWWDSLILASAQVGRCSVIASEDFTHGSKIRGIGIVNPLVAQP